MLKVHENAAETETSDKGPTLDELAREGARRMLVKALAMEVTQYIEEHAGDRDEQGHRLVVRNGQAQARKVTCGAGTLEVRAPRVNDKRVNADGARLHQSHPPPLHAALAAGRGGPADLVFARVVDWGLP